MRKIMVFAILACLGSVSSSAQDDMYFTPSKKAKAEAKKDYQRAQEIESRYENDYGTRTYYYVPEEIDVDKYNRRGIGFTQLDSTATDVIGFYTEADSISTDSIITALRNSEDYKYSRQLERYYDGRPVNVYIVNNYDTWYYNPWYYDSWYWNSWGYGPYWRHRWAYYDPWYYGPYWYRPYWYRPLFWRTRTYAYTRGGTANRGRVGGVRGYSGIQRGTATSRNNSGYSGIQRSENFSHGSSFGGGGSFSRGGGSLGGGSFGGGGRGPGSFGGGHR